MWGPLDVKPDSCLSIHLEPLTVYVQRSGDEWHFTHSYDSSDALAEKDAEIIETTPPPDQDWLRLVSARDESLELMPALPDRPLVIRPESPISIFPGRFARFFVPVPVWLRFVAVQGTARTDVIDIPSRMLSNTWFGDPAGGEICYSLDALLRRTPERLRYKSSSVTCVLVVRNSSSEKLNFERIRVHVENLSIFEHEEILWTNEIEVLYKGTDQVSQLEIKDKPPADLLNARKITEPRVIPDKNILRRSYSFIRQFTGI